MTELAITPREHEPCSTCLPVCLEKEVLLAHACVATRCAECMEQFFKKELKMLD